MIGLVKAEGVLKFRNKLFFTIVAQGLGTAPFAVAITKVFKDGS